MKKDQSSYVNVRALSHASLQKFRHSVNEPKPELHPKEILFNTKPNIKYYSNSNQQANTVVLNKKNQTTSKNQQQLKKKIKVLEYELKKKINDHCYLVKLFKTKTNNELSHIDLYVEFNNLEQELESRNAKIKQLEQKLQESSKEVEDLLSAKNEHEEKHTDVITSFTANLDKLQKKHATELASKENMIQNQRRMREEKDILLKEIRKKYEQSQVLLNSLENELMEAKTAKRQIEKAYEERIENTRQDFLIRLQQNNRQIQKYSLRIRQQEQTIRQLRQQTNSKQSQKAKSVKKLQAELIAKQKQLQEQSGRLNSAEQELNSLYSEKQAFQEKEHELVEELEVLKKELKNQESSYRKEIERIVKQIDSNKIVQKQYGAKYEKYEKQLGKLEQKLSQANATIKVLHFQKQDKQIALEKVKQALTHKEKMLQQKEQSIEDLQSKLYTIERKSTSAHERIKQLEKQITSNKQTGAHHSKIEIENYKCMGRLTELIHQIQLTISEAGYSEDQRQHHQNNGKLKMNTRARTKTVESQQPETVTECVDMLTKQLEIFMKKLYTQTLTENNQSKQLIQQIVCDIKSIFHAYNSYVQDEQLKGATRQYLQCLDSNEKNVKKSRNNYLQIIMERLISMIAIQSYTSENGLSRQGESKGKFSRRRHVDSLEDTGSRWQENEDNTHKLYIQQRPIRQQRRKTAEQTQSRYIRNESKKKLQKLITQPSQVQNFPIRKQLEYGKQNYMQRINMNKHQNPSYNEISSKYNSTGEESGYLHKYYGENGRKIPAVKRSQIDGDEIMKQMRKDKKSIISEAELIEKKYFR